MKFSAEDAERLYKILDNEIGVFRQENMDEYGLKFVEDKHTEFIEMFSSDAPESYWFQGNTVHSATLICSEDGLVVESVSIPEEDLMKINTELADFYSSVLE